MSQPQLDLVFVVDNTGSMSSYINEAQKSIHSIITEITALEKCSVRFGLVSYRDHPPQDHTYITQVHPFTSSIKTAKSYVDTMAANGGGDGPEAVTAGLNAALQFDYRKESAKVIVLIADAPPHGLEPTGDGFPDGDPDGFDPLKIATDMAERDIIIYSVCVEPTLSQSYKFGRDFMIALAKITNGQYIALKQANILAKVIVGGALEEIGLQKIMAIAERTAEESGITDEKARVEYVTQKLKEQNLTGYKVEVENIYENLDFSNSEIIQNASTLADAKAKLLEANKLTSQNNYSNFGAFPGAGYGGAPRGYGGYPGAPGGAPPCSPPGGSPLYAPPGGYAAAAAGPPPPPGAYAECMSFAPSVASADMSGPPVSVSNSSATQCASYAPQAYSHQQVERVLLRNKKSKGYYDSTGDK